MATKRIKATTTFLHGTKRFEEGKKYTVSLEEAAYFNGNGWATASDGSDVVPNDAVDEPVTLEVHDGEVTTTAPKVEVKG